MTPGHCRFRAAKLWYKLIDAVRIQVFLIGGISVSNKKFTGLSYQIFFCIHNQIERLILYKKQGIRSEYSCLRYLLNLTTVEVLTRARQVDPDPIGSGFEKF
jgi:hypothetical protein